MFSVWVFALVERGCEGQVRVEVRIVESKVELDAEGDSERDGIDIIVSASQNCTN